MFIAWRLSPRDTIPNETGWTCFLHQLYVTILTLWLTGYNIQLRLQIAVAVCCGCFILEPRAPNPFVLVCFPLLHALTALVMLIPRVRHRAALCLPSRRLITGARHWATFCPPSCSCWVFGQSTVEKLMLKCLVVLFLFHFVHLLILHAVLLEYHFPSSSFLPVCLWAFLTASAYTSGVTVDRQDSFCPASMRVLSIALSRAVWWFTVLMLVLFQFSFVRFIFLHAFTTMIFFSHCGTGNSLKHLLQGLSGHVVLLQWFSSLRTFWRIVLLALVFFLTLPCVTTWSSLFYPFLVCGVYKK